MERELDMELSDDSEETLEEVEDTPSPEESKEEVTPEADPALEEVTPEVELFDLPDGRKVDAAGLREEYNKLLPEFTRKSQKLAEYEKKGDINSKDFSDQPKWKNPDYVPESYSTMYEEVADYTKKQVLQEIRETFEKEQARTKEIQNQVEGELNEIRKIDPKLDENALFVHANKYGLQNLKFAYQNMKDMKKAIIDTEQKTIKNLKAREADPVSTGASPASTDEDGYDPNEMSVFQNANEFLARIKGNKK
jgi:DNA repair exonuclease SbcCD ATPase subunit